MNEKNQGRTSSQRPSLRLWLEDNDNSESNDGVQDCRETQRVLVDLDHVREIVESSIQQNLYENASEFAANLVTLSGGSPQDVYLLARTYYLNKQYRRAIHVLQHYNLLRDGTTLNIVVEKEKPDVLYYIHLASKCWIESGKPDDAQVALETLLGDATNEALRDSSRKLQAIRGNKQNLEDVQMDGEKALSAPASVDVLASLCLLRGRVYEIVENRARSVRWFKAALFCDVYCLEAFHALLNNQLQPVDEMRLLQELRAGGSFSSPRTAWLESVYLTRLSKHDHRNSVASNDRMLANTIAKGVESSDKDIPSLAQDLSCISSKAERLYYQHDAQAAFRLTEKVRQQDPFHIPSIIVHLAALVDLKRTSELFHLSHQLVDAYPKMAVSWYAVGCYYFAINRLDASRRYFHKATVMDPHMATAWLGFGHAFAAQDESEQAMAAYRTAARLCIGSHLPLLFTAIEYLRTNNLTLAEQFCLQAQSMCATDPLVLNELGVVFYRKEQYQAAVQCFKQCLKLCESRQASLMIAWEPAIFNLAHSLRKLCMYDEAVEYYQQALGYNTTDASTYAALGLTHHLKGDLEAAIEHYHQALGLKPEDTFASEMLEKALSQSYGERRTGAMYS